MTTDTETPGLLPIADDMIGSKVGPYVLLRRVGQGAMGVVYEARHEHIGGRAAVKVLMRELARDPRVLQRFLDEARTMTLVQHDGIVKVFDYGQLSHGVPYILMEFLEGQSLQERLLQATSQGMGLSLPVAIEITRQVASALSSLHKKNIIHRDLKPDKISPVGKLGRISRC
ncbi:MAG: serine/threonine protein kinase [Myxococcales bacterium]|jgi:serine/threonine protein kinase|nr:serine/threonine protein kinase [Myxococcales bacterium]